MSPKAFLALGAAIMLAACSQSADAPHEAGQTITSKDERLRTCAVHEFAVMALLRDQKITREQAPRHPDPYSTMVYINSYYIPKDIPEKEAMAEVKALAEDLVQEKSAEAIITYADDCLDKTPKL